MKIKELKKNTLILSVILSIVIGCEKGPETTKESWIDKPITEWPDFSLTNEVSFIDTTYKNLANAFLVNTGKDTIGISCKHLFIVFENKHGIQAIDLGEEFIYWNLYPKNRPDKVISIKKLINAEASEQIGQFNTLKARDWIVFELRDKREDVYPLKIRFSPVYKNEIVYAVGWGVLQKNNTYPAITKLRCFKSLGDYFYTTSINKDIRPEGRSGSPVIDKNGYLVGIVSGVEGNLGVICGVKYLNELFDRYGIEYAIP